MAHFVEGGAEGTETGAAAAAAPATMDINQWLKANRLSKLKGYLEEMEIEMEDLVTFSETHMEFRFVYREQSEEHTLIHIMYTTPHIDQGAVGT